LPPLSTNAQVLHLDAIALLGDDLILRVPINDPPPFVAT
jgi:hypothetical protein